MLFRKAAWPGLADGSITVALRWWNRPTVRAGGSLRTPAGVLSIDAVEVVDPLNVTEQDAARAGHPNLAALLEELGPGDQQRQLHRITFHYLGEDDRDRLRQDDHLDDEARAEVLTRLTRMDRVATAPWTISFLQLIAERPGVVSTELAQVLGMDRDRFKADVRKLKALGLTESLEVGYRLSPRGTALLEALDSGRSGR